MTTTAPEFRTVDGRREAWIVYMLVGGWVCGEPDPGKPDDICGMPVESEPCNIHHPDAGMLLPHDLTWDDATGSYVSASQLPSH